MSKPFESMMQETVARELVRWAAGHLITCPECGEILDAGETVVITDADDHTLVRCAKCYGKPAGSFTSGSVTVWDGRTLWKRKGKLWTYKE